MAFKDTIRFTVLIAKKNTNKILITKETIKEVKISKSILNKVEL